MSNHFGTPAQIEAARLKRRKEVQEWARNMHAEAEAAKFGPKIPVFSDEPVYDDEPDEPETVAEPEPDEEPSVEPELAEEPEPETPVEEPKKATKSTSKGSAAAK